MKRDMDLVRNILIKTAESDQPLGPKVFMDEQHDFQVVAYHFDIMKQAGLLEAITEKEMGGTYVLAEAIGLTWAGQDFLASVASRDVWKEVRKRLGKYSGDAALTTIKAVAIEVAKKLMVG